MHVYVQATLDGLNGGLYTHIHYLCMCVSTKYVSLCVCMTVCNYKLQKELGDGRTQQKLDGGETEEEMI